MLLKTHAASDSATLARYLGHPCAHLTHNLEDSLMNNPLVIVLLIALVAAIGAAVWLYMRNQRTEQLQSRFGPEYDRAVSEHRDQRQAERELEQRAERVDHLNIRPLTTAERDRYADLWRSVQTRFVDDPSGATDEADQLVGEVMATRGY